MGMETVEDRIKQFEEHFGVEITPGESLYDCDDCKDRGTIQREKGGPVEYCECDEGEFLKSKDKEQRKSTVVSRLRNAEIPARYKTATVKDFEGTNVSKVAGRFVEGWEKIMNDSVIGKKGLYLHGAPGTGKTHAAIAVMKEFIKRGSIRGLFSSVPKMLSRMRPGGWGGDTYMEELINAEFLVLDDLGREKESEWVEERIYIILNERYNELRPTIVTSKYSIKKLGTRDGRWDDISDRISEFLFPVLMDGKSYRADTV